MLPHPSPSYMLPGPSPICSPTHPLAICSPTRPLYALQPVPYMLPHPSPSYMLPHPSPICSPTLLKNKKKELMLHPSPICSPYLIKSEGVREVNDGHEQPLVRLGLYLHSQQRANSVSNESQPPSPSSTAQPYTPHSSFTHQAVQTRNAKSGGSSRTSWRQTSRPSNKH